MGYGQRYGDGSLFKRGSVYYFQYFEDGKPRQVSTRSERLDQAKKFRDQLLGKKLRGEWTHATTRVTCGELLDDLIEHSKINVKESTARIWKWCIEANVRAFSVISRRLISRRAPEGISREAESGRP